MGVSSNIRVLYYVNSYLWLDVFSNISEAGFYRPGEFGVRLKNVLEVVDTGKTHPNGMKFLEFRQVTLVPFEPKLIDPTLLNAMEVRKIKYIAGIL